MKHPALFPMLALALLGLTACNSADEGATTQVRDPEEVAALGQTAGNEGSGPQGGAAASELATSAAEAGGEPAEPPAEEAPVEEPGTPSADPEDANASDPQTLPETTGDATQMSDSCCAAHDAAGCDDAAIEACVCAEGVLPQCCTDSWSAACVELVRQRHCDPGVRECVCTEWEQTSCCDTDWTNNFCDTTAELKCGATIGCHH